MRWIFTRSAVKKKMIPIKTCIQNGMSNECRRCAFVWLCVYFCYTRIIWTPLYVNNMRCLSLFLSISDSHLRLYVHVHGEEFWECVWCASAFVCVMHMAMQQNGTNHLNSVYHTHTHIGIELNPWIHNTLQTHHTITSRCTLARVYEWFSVACVRVRWQLVAIVFEFL